MRTLTVSDVDGDQVGIELLPRPSVVRIQRTTDGSVDFVTALLLIHQ